VVPSSESSQVFFEYIYVLLSLVSLLLEQVEEFGSLKVPEAAGKHWSQSWGKKKRGRFLVESNNSMCSATNNKSTVCVHSGVKYDNLNGKCLESRCYITLDAIPSQQQF